MQRVGKTDAKFSNQIQELKAKRLIQSNLGSNCIQRNLLKRPLQALCREVSECTCP